MTEGSDAKLRVQEHFVSVQGEGAWVGTPSRFIRLSGCNLRCDWCDSPASSWDPQGDFVHLDALVAAAAAGPRHVVLTGGEPLLFPASVPLVQALRDAGHKVTIETAGTLTQPGIACELMSISPKLAHSTPSAARTRLAQAHETRRFAPAIIRELIACADATQLKYVVRSRQIDADLEEIDAQLKQIDPHEQLDRAQIFLMPEGTDPRELAKDYARLLPHCQAKGFRLGQRLHISLFGHRPGT